MNRTIFTALSTCLLIAFAFNTAGGGEDGVSPSAGTNEELFSAGSQQLLKIFQAWKDSTSPLVRDGDKLAQRRDYKGAIDFYSLDLQLHESSQTRFRRAYALTLIKKYDLAIEDCTTILNADPKHYESQAIRAWCLVCVNRIGEAIREYEALSVSQPEESSHAFALGTLHARAKDYSKADECFARAIRCRPQESDAYLGRCRCLLLLKQEEQAVEQIIALLKRVPEQAGGYARTPQFARELSADELEHGRKQVDAMLKDRPEMALGITPDDMIYKWAIRKFAGEDIPERIVWDSSPPEGTDANHSSPHKGQPGVVRIAHRKRGLLGVLPGRKLTFDELWSDLCFELHNIQGTLQFQFVYALVERGEISREGFIRQCAFTEYQALLRTRAFYVDAYLPWTRERKVATVPANWRLNTPTTFEQWISGYKDHSSYPWEPYGGYYDSLKQRKNAGLVDERATK